MAGQVQHLELAVADVDDVALVDQPCHWRRSLDEPVDDTPAGSAVT